MATKRNDSQRPPGWVRVQFDVPAAVAKRLAAAHQEIAADRVKTKVLGTSALLAFLSMPKSVREELYFWVKQREDRVQSLTSDAIGPFLLSLLSDVTRRPLPPTESKGGKLVRVVEPPVQREGYTEQVIREVEVAPPKPEEGGPRRAVEGG